MLFLSLLYGAESGLGPLNSVFLRETTTSIKSVRTQTSLGFLSCKPVKVLNARMCTHIYIYRHAHKNIKTLLFLHGQSIYLVL